MNVFKLGFLLITVICSQANAGINEYVESIKSDPNALYAFFKKMPKGGELHYHFSGGSYAETMLGLASTRANYCLDPTTFIISRFSDVCHGKKVAQLLKDDTLYNRTLRAWSMKNFIPDQESGHDHFFSAFMKFGPIDRDFSRQLLAGILKRAFRQHELYMELITFDLRDSAKYAVLIQAARTFADKQRILLADPSFQESINQIVNQSTHLLPKTRTLLGCDTKPQKAVCSVAVKFQYFVKREAPLNDVFAQALAGFVAASRSNMIVGVNLVQAEDGFYSLHDYHAHMEIFNFLHTAFPKVHISLHAGELEPQAVTLADLRFHIRDAMFTGHAERIGHGVDIAYENHSLDLINYMAKKQVPVEINLTSNRAILNISGKKHPLNYYITHRVPVVLSTDDEGILRTNLTRQYVDAVENHHLSYATIKAINRNALTYSFLPGNSIWSDPVMQILVPECKHLMSRTCKKYIKGSEKATLQWQLENKLAVFEEQLPLF